MSRRRALATVLATTVVASLAVGCGVPLQNDPARLPIPRETSAPRPTQGGVQLVSVYMIRDGRLEAELRTAADTSAASMVALLAAGPSASERREGTTTAVAPGDYTILSTGRTTVVDVPLPFTQVPGDLQLLAAAQLVWTVTGQDPRSGVRMTFDGEAIEIPTDQGLSSGAVRRWDFASVAPPAG